MEPAISARQSFDSPSRTLAPFESSPLLRDRSASNPYSLRKGKVSKKLFHIFNDNGMRKLQQDIGWQTNFQRILRQSDMHLKGQKKVLNDVIMVPRKAMLESQLVTFPSIEVKKKNQVQAKPQVRRSRGVSQLRRQTLQEIRNGSTSHIIQGNSKSQSQQNLKKLYQSNHADDRPKRKGATFISRNLNFIQSSPSPRMKMSQQKQSSPTKFSSVQSVLKLQPIMNPEKKFKKGYLVYEPNGEEYWSKIKSSFEQEPQLKWQGKLLTAKSYYVLDINNFRPMLALRAQQPIQIASLTKIMTCYLSLLICRKYEAQLKQWTYRVPDRIVGTPGTSAELEAGDLLTGQDLLYALMLPSGNDASICLAQLMGKVIQKNRKKQQSRSFFQTFVGHMNSFSKELGLNQEWNNSSGLSWNPNFSTAQAIVALSALAMQNPIFKKVVSTKQWTADIKNDRYGLTRKKSWKNTNKLLDQGWQGVKTGTTQTAGHCLLSKKEDLIIGVFDCQTLNRRFTQSVKIYGFIKQNS